MRIKVVVKVFNREHRKYRYFGFSSVRKLNDYLETAGEDVSICRIYEGKDAKNICECRNVVELIEGGNPNVLV